MSDVPGADISRFIAASGIKCIVFLDDPKRLIELAMYEHGVRPLDALRGCTHFFTSFARVLQINSVLVWRSDRVDINAAALVGEIAAGILPESSAERIGEILAAVLPDIPEIPSAEASPLDRIANVLRPAGAVPAIPSSEEVDIIDRVLSYYRNIYSKDGLAEVAWPRELFLDENQFSLGPEGVRMTGDAREIMRGPCCFLPAGRWRITIGFEVIGNKSGNDVEADVALGFGLGSLARGKFALPAYGAFQYSLDFTVDEARAPIEARLRLVKASIEGTLGLRFAFASRISKESAGEPALKAPRWTLPKPIKPARSIALQ